MLAPAATVLAILVTLFAFLASRNPFGRISTTFSRAPLSTMVNATKAPVYSLSHGGPPSRYQVLFGLIDARLRPRKLD